MQVQKKIAKYKGPRRMQKDHTKTPKNKIYTSFLIKKRNCKIIQKIIKQLRKNFKLTHTYNQGKNAIKKRNIHIYVYTHIYKGVITHRHVYIDTHLHASVKRTHTSSVFVYYTSTCWRKNKLNFD